VLFEKGHLINLQNLYIDIFLKIRTFPAFRKPIPKENRIEGVYKNQFSYFKICGANIKNVFQKKKCF
jgi:hypothetical protein